MSEAPPDNPKDAPTETKAEVAATDAPKDAASPTATALSEAARAMDTAEKKADAASPTNGQAAAAERPAVETATAPSPAANTSGMHLQYVAPGVRRQSWLETNKYQLVVYSVLVLFGFLLLRGGLGGADLSGKSAGGGGGGGDLVGPAPAQSTQSTPVDDNSYQPLANRMAMPTADLTVNAGAIGGSTRPTVVAHGDAGANKGGYADERADLDTAEAMVPKDPDKALALVDKHDKDYPRGILDPDARIIRIEAFQKKGDDVKALALADEFLQDYPHSPRAGRVQSIAEQIKNKGGGGTTP